MASEHTVHVSKSIFTGLMALSFQFLGTIPLDQAALRLHYVLCQVAEQFLGGLPGMVVAVFKTTNACALSHASFLFVLQALAQFCPLLRFIFSAV